MSDATAIATLLAIPTPEITRALDDHEQAEWAFYRVSARNREEVWRRAQAAWRDAGVSDRKAATILGIPRRNIRNVLLQQESRILDLETAAKLSSALSLPGPHTLLEGIEGVAPLAPQTPERT